MVGGGRKKIANRRKGHMSIGQIFALHQASDPSSARHIPQINAPVHPTHSQTAAIRGKADGPSAHWPIGERDEGGAAGQLPEVTPFPAAQVFLAWLRPVPVEQPARLT